MPVVLDIFTSYLSQNKFVFILYFILSILVNIIYSLFIPRMISQFISATMNKRDSFGKNIYGTIQTKSKLGILYVLGGLFLVFVFLDYLKHYVENIFIITGTTNNFKKSMMEHIFKKYSQSYIEISENSVLWILNNSFTPIKHVMIYTIVQLIPYIILFSIISAYLFTISKPVFYLVVLQFFIVLGIMISFHNPFLKSSGKIETVVLYNNEFIGDRVKNLMNIIFDNNVEKEIMSIKSKEETLKHTIRSGYQIENNIIFLIDSCSYVIFFFVLYYLMFKEQSILYSVIIILLLNKSTQEDLIRETLAQYYNLAKLIKMNKMVENIGVHKKCISFHNFYSIKMNNISYRYDKKSDYVLKNLNIHFEPRKLNVMVGKSGSGKTTIMKLIVKLYTPTKGNILFDDIDAEDICESDVRDNIYYVNQRTTMFDESVLYNLQYGNETSPEIIIELLKKYDLFDYYSTLEKGLDSATGINGSHLSLGMQKIIMVVRGILKPNKCILILDEPLTSLDKETRHKIVKLIVEETKHKTVIIISHDPEILPYADNIIRLQRE